MKKRLLKPLVKNRKLKYLLRFLLLLEIILLIIISGVIISTILTYKTTESWDISIIKKVEKEFPDSGFIKDKIYIVEGTDGVNANIEVNITIFDKKIKLNSYSLKIDPAEDKKYKGETEYSVIEEKLKTDLNEFISKLKVGEIDRFKVDNNEKLENISYKNSEFKDQENLFIVQNNNIDVGKFVTNLNNCNYEASVGIKYSLETNTFNLDISDDYLNSLCTKYSVPENAITATCSDCTFFPSDKHHTLTSEYAPEIRGADAIAGGVLIGTIAYPDLVAMANDARDAGHNFYLNSGYRSYSVQQETFEGWVQYEMSFGSDRHTAELKANAYSAKPGFSEHQLGTVVDIISQECAGFERECQPSKDVWTWLYDNAWKYGFALSYQKDKENLTEYVYEPWHYRWIGRDLAKEYKEKYEQKSYLSEFLRNKKLY